MAGTITATTIQNDTSSPPTFRNNSIEIGTLCRAWCNFDGTTSPPTIRANFNVSSITKHTTGDYTVNFTNAFADANYSVQSLVKGQAAAFQGLITENHDRTRTASGIPLLTARRDNGTPFDTTQCNVAVFR
jgi:hypothetical protein